MRMFIDSHGFWNYAAKLAFETQTILDNCALH